MGAITVVLIFIIGPYWNMTKKSLNFPVEILCRSEIHDGKKKRLFF